MKVEIKASGTLVIQAESELDSYALDHWSKENFKDHEKPGEISTENILINLDFPLITKEQGSI